MPTSSRRTRVSVIERLLAAPQDFQFLQAVRLLERAAVFTGKQKSGDKHADHPVAVFSPPIREAVRFIGDLRLRFPESEISRIKQIKRDDGQIQHEVMVSFIGLSGAMGVLPQHYAEMILQRIKLRDYTLAHFFNLFNHRTTSLFFQASAKYRLPLEYERSQLHTQTKTKDCTHTQTLLSFLGLATQGLKNRQSLRDESLIFYSGLLSHQLKTPSGLSQMLAHYFDVPVRTEGFVGQWQDLIDDVRTRLPSKKNRKGQNVCLGRSSMLGRRGWFAQGKSRIVVGPLNKEQYDRFAPGTGAMRALNELTASYLGMTEDYDFTIEVKRENIPKRVALNKSEPPKLAWNTWLSGKPNTQTSKDDILEIKVSSKTMN